MGMPTSASANSGVPPIAYTSEIALVAAMRPKCVRWIHAGRKDIIIPMVSIIAAVTLILVTAMNNDSLNKKNFIANGYEQVLAANGTAQWRKVR